MLALFRAEARRGRAAGANALEIPLSCKEGLSWLYGLQKLGMKLGLENSRDLCAILGHPERSFTSILVAGTNGKGSVAAMLESILRAAGLATGLYTSPHLVRPEERIRIGGRDIEPGPFDESLQRVRQAIDRSLGGPELSRHPTFFEVLTAMAFDAFSRARVEVGVLEVGLGGRFDATNIVDPALSIVCGVDLDHQEQLGSDLASIAREKAGVFRSGRPALIGEEKAEAREQLERIARGVGSRALFVFQETLPTVVDDGLRLPDEGGGWLELDLDSPARSYRRLRVPLPGRHQARNVALAVRAAEVLAEERGFALQEGAIRRGLESTRWAGRLEWVAGSPALLLDCAHNPAGAAALAAALRRIGPRRCVLLFGAMQDKDFAGMARELAGCMRAVVATRAKIDRSADPEEVIVPFREAASGEPAVAVATVAAALSSARSLAGPSGIVCGAGSIYLVGEIKGLLEAGQRR
ncbi:MAG: bifunctional folylpolyglutamate synthase/dihydrofolate synthase [Acidobacteria bacterium]|nr:MAG: bifunctional folylpolyglutamate synthase/dihydrofolate synthase [Acidobacteriota bacterium]